jgi:flavin reductase (DIM6/NTAB) family NADH-FMN oxidoreductase RutF
LYDATIDRNYPIIGLTKEGAGVTGSGIDSLELRKAFGCFPTGITVVTALDGEGCAVGITANSFSSLSLDPPLVLWSVDKRSTTFPVFNTSPHFVVSVLSATGGAVADRFARKGSHKIEDIDTLPTELGPPTFSDSLAVFECEVFDRHEGGDHIIMVGKVLRFAHQPDSKENGEGALVYYRGRFANVAPVTE